MTVQEFIDGFDEIAILDICEGGIGHSFFGEEEIECIDEDLLNKPVESSLVIKKKYGYHVVLEV